MKLIPRCIVVQPHIKRAKTSRIEQNNERQDAVMNVAFSPHTYKMAATLRNRFNLTTMWILKLEWRLLDIEPWFLEICLMMNSKLCTYIAIIEWIHAPDKNIIICPSSFSTKRDDSKKQEIVIKIARFCVAHARPLMTSHFSLLSILLTQLWWRATAEEAFASAVYIQLST